MDLTSLEIFILPKIVKNQLGLVAVPRPDGKALLFIPFKDQNTGEVHNYYATADQIQAPSINEYTTSQSFKLTALYRKGIWANLQSWTPEIFEGTVRFDYTNPVDEQITLGITKENPNGITMGVAEGLEVLLKYLSDNGQEL